MARKQSILEKDSAPFREGTRRFSKRALGLVGTKEKILELGL